MKLKTWGKNDVQRGTRVLLRIDANVPFRGKRLATDARVRLAAAVPEIKRLVARKARVIIVTHLGDPGGRRNVMYSVYPIAEMLSDMLGRDVRCMPQVLGPRVDDAVAAMKPGEVLLLENVRFEPGEETNSAVFARHLAELADVYVNNAFAVCHRKHASVHAITKYLPSFAGELVLREVAALNAPRKAPFVLVLGGAKLSTKIPLLRELGYEAASMLLGGGLSVTFAQADYGALPVAAPALTQADDVKTAVKILEQHGQRIVLPIDLALDKKHTTIVDIGPATVELFIARLKTAKTVVWNGPLGIIEQVNGQAGTRAVAHAIAGLKGVTSIVGGGETIEFLEDEGLLDRFTHVSTGGGAMLAFLGDEAMPGLEPLFIER